MGLNGKSDNETAYAAVSQNEADYDDVDVDGRDQAALRPQTTTLTRRRKIFLAVGILLIVSLLYSFTPVSRPRTSNSNLVASGPPGKLHVLIPASKPDVNLCKTMLSSAIVGYGSPVIINWNQEFTNRSQSHGGSHLAKISGVYDYIHSLNRTYDEDLVMMIDGYDLWMQLRPQTLLDRYFEINRQADARIQSELGAENALSNGIRQEIVFGCQKKCWPWHSNDPPCYAVPKSTLPDDIFGPKTDQLSRNPVNHYNNYRPRFLVSGTAIGPVRAFRKLFAEALALMEIEPNRGSDQYIFSHIFGNQEIWREIVRRDAANATRTTHSDWKPDHIATVRKKAEERMDGNYEFGIGIDYRSEVVLNTVFAENDTAWLVTGDERAVSASQSNHHVPYKYRTKGLATDISNTLPPLSGLADTAAPRSAHWEDVPLFTNVFTGIQPAIVHHNAHVNNLKKVRESWWPMIWFQRDARDLFDAWVKAPVTAFATAGYDKNTGLREWWPSEERKGGGRNGSETGWIQFEDICKPWHVELFLDGRGMWRYPEKALEGTQAP